LAASGGHDAVVSFLLEHFRPSISAGVLQTAWIRSWQTSYTSIAHLLADAAAVADVNLDYSLCLQGIVEVDAADMIPTFLAQLPGTVTVSLSRDCVRSACFSNQIASLRMLQHVGLLSAESVLDCDLPHLIRRTHAETVLFVLEVAGPLADITIGTIAAAAITGNGSLIELLLDKFSVANPSQAAGLCAHYRSGGAVELYFQFPWFSQSGMLDAGRHGHVAMLERAFHSAGPQGMPVGAFSLLEMISYAISAKKLSTVQFLLPILRAMPIVLFTLLTNAVLTQDQSILRLLCEHCPKTSGTIDEIHAVVRALMTCAVSCRLEECEMLIELLHRLDQFPRDVLAMLTRALAAAPEDGCVWFVSSLLEYALLDKVFDTIDSLLAIAAKSGRVRMVELLLSCGASARAAGMGKVLKTCHDLGHFAVIDLLVSWGARMPTINTPKVAAQARGSVFPEHGPSPSKP